MIGLRFEFVILVELTIERYTPGCGVDDGGDEGPSLLLFSTQHTT